MEQLKDRQLLFILSVSLGCYFTAYFLDVAVFRGDSLTFHNKTRFTTFDRDHDTWSGGNCAVLRHGAWWYVDCYKSNLNGLYKPEGASDDDGLHWYHWKSDWRFFKRVEMKIKQ